MRKVVSILLAVIMLFALAACSKEEASLTGTYTGDGLTVTITEDGAVTWTQGEETLTGTCKKSDSENSWILDLEGNEKAEYVVTLNEMNDGTTELWLMDASEQTIALIKE